MQCGRTQKDGDDMQIGFAPASSKEGLKALWRTVFGDPEAYIDLFLEHRFRPEQTLCVFEGGRPVSMLFLLPLEMASGGRSYPAQYVYGVATGPAYRGKGLSSGLMERAQEVLIERGGALSVLVPAQPPLFSFYRKRGYETEFSISRISYRADPAFPGALPELRETSLAELEPLRNRAFSASRLFGRWDREALRYQDRESAFFGGCALAFETEEGEGYALCVTAGERVLVKELVLPPANPPEGWEAAAAPLFEAVLRRAGAKELSAALWEGESAVPFAMTRWNPKTKKILTGEAKPYFSLVLD